MNKLCYYRNNVEYNRRHIYFDICLICMHKMNIQENMKRQLKNHFINKKLIIKILLLILIVSNFGISFAYWANSISGSQTNSNPSIQMGQWEYTELAVANFRANHADVLALNVDTVQISDQAAVEAALSAYGLLSENAKAELIADKTLLLDLLTQIIALQNSEFLDFEGYVYDSLFTSTLEMNGRTWYSNNTAISNSPSYDVWIDTRALALKTGSYFESRDLFINGIDRITLFHGALKYNTTTSFAFKVMYALQSNPTVWLTVQENGSDLIVDVDTGNPLTYVEINVNVTEALNIRFTPVISNSTDYINLDNIRIYEHVVANDLEVATFRSVYAGALSLSVETVLISDKTSVEAALAAYDLLSVDAKAELTAEKALLDSLLIEIFEKEAIAAATTSVIIAENSKLQADVNAAQVLVSALPTGLEKTALQNRLDIIQDIIDAVQVFKYNYASVLALTVNTVQTSDKSAIEAAILAHDSLSEDVKALLTAEKALLVSLIIEINNQIPTAAQVAAFRADHAIVLALSVGTVQISDRAAVEAALTAYDLLSNDAKAELTAEKALLDSLLVEIYIKEATALVVIAESSNLQADLNAAQVLVTALPDNAEKTALQNRLNVVQDIITANILAAGSVDNLITAIPSTGLITLGDRNQIEAARSAYEALTSAQKLLVVYEILLISAESELAALQSATDLVVIAENSELQADVNAAQVLVTALPNGTAKTALQNRLNAVQDIIDVQAAVSIITIYFNANDVDATNLNNNANKQAAFLAKANQIVSGLDVTITVTSSVRIKRTNHIYTIQIVKNGAQATISVDVTFY